MNIKEFSRECPKCYRILFYKTLKIKKTSEKLKKICKKCANSGDKNPNFGKKCSNKTRDKISKANKGKIVSLETRKKQSQALSGSKNPMFGRKGVLCPSYGKTVTDEHKNKLSKLKKGVSITKQHKDNISKGLFGKTHSDDTKKKMRLSKINHIIKKNNSIRPSYNINACKYFENLEKQHGWNGFYATKNKEYFLPTLGYFLDYYEPNFNFCIEYDEPKHYYVNNELKDKDVKRMNEIKNILNCKFFRYNEKLQELNEY